MASSNTPIGQSHCGTDAIAMSIHDLTIARERTNTEATGQNGDSRGFLSQGTTASATDESMHSNQATHASPRPTFLSTFDMNSNFLPFKALCKNLKIGQIVALSKTCRAFASAYMETLHTEWDINERLRKFVDNPRRFRTQMAHNDVLIAGPFALHFLSRTDQEASGWGHLDVLVQQGKKANAFVQALCDVEEYELLALDPMMKGPITDVKTYMKFGKNTTDATDVIIVNTTTGPPLQALLQEASSTVTLNFITWNKAFSIFPLTTFIQQKAYLGDGYTGSTRSELQRMGWSITAPIIPNPQSRNHPVQAERRIGDRRTWSIALKTDGVEPSETPDSVIEDSFFSMHGFPFRTSFPVSGSLESKGPRYSGYRPSAFKNFAIATFQLPARYTYLISHGPFRVFIVNRLKNFMETVPSPDRHVDVSYIWTYSDEQYTSWCNTWEEAEAARLEMDAQRFLA